MNLFPERAGRGTRWILPTALLLSLFVHFVGGPAARWWWPRVQPALAKVLPIPTPGPEIVALSDAITIEKRTVPRPARRAPRTQQPQREQRPRMLARAPATEALPEPTLPPLATAPPRAIHHPRSEPTLEPKPRVPPSTAPAERNALSPQQLAALDQRFSRTIAQAQRSLTDVPPQRRPPARNPQQQRYEAIMAGTPEQFLSAQGTCDPIQSDYRGAWHYYYLRCLINYSDGYFEEVSFLWPYKFPARNDPIDISMHSAYRPTFGMQGPPPGFVLPEHFALSRAICSFYQQRCADIIARERANGNQPATDAP